MPEPTYLIAMLIKHLEFVTDDSVGREALILVTENELHKN